MELGVRCTRGHPGLCPPPNWYATGDSCRLTITSLPNRDSLRRGHADLIERTPPLQVCSNAVNAHALRNTINRCLSVCLSVCLCNILRLCLRVTCPNVISIEKRKISAVWFWLEARAKFWVTKTKHMHARAIFHPLPRPPPHLGDRFRFWFAW